MIRVFTHTHLVGAGIVDYGQVGVMPISVLPTPKLLSHYGFRSEFSHHNESSKPGYYRVNLLSSQIQAEFTATSNVAMHRYTWQQADSIKTILFDVGEALWPGSVVAATAVMDASRNEISGEVKINGPLSGRFGGFTLFYSARFPIAWTRSGVWNTTKSDVINMYPGQVSISGPGSGAYLVFDSAPSMLTFALGISTISVQQASTNIDLQVGSASFDDIRAKVQADWEAELSAVDVKVPSGSDQDAFWKDSLIQFYSAMYRTHMAPTSFEELPQAVGAAPLYRGFDKNVHVLPQGMKRYYSDMSIWDTHRTEMPWLVLLNPDRAADMSKSLLLMFQQGGDLPRWPMADGYTNCMIGTHAIVILADSFFKGASFNLSLAYQAMVQAATMQQVHAGRTDLPHYLQYGYVSAEASNKAVSETLEYAYDDWALGNFAKYAMNRPSEANVFFNRSQNYRNVWSAEKFFCPRSITGAFECPWTWVNPFDNNYIEGDAWQWRFFVPQDPAGLAGLFGSRDEFIQQLDYFISHAKDFPDLQKIGLPNLYYWSGNEPDIFAPWMFSFVGRSDLTQKWTRHQIATQYSSKADGVPGNDDFGTMSAWQIFAMLGFYPQAGSDRYIVGSPVFPEVTIRRALGNIHIIAHNASNTNIYVQKLTVNGVQIDLVNAPWFSHKDIHYGGELEFWMSPSPL